MDSIKKFFEKKKTDTKFKKAGPGQLLSASGSSSSGRRQQNNYNVPKQRQAPSNSAQKAGEAALHRFAGNKANTPVDWSMHAIKAQARREMEAEKKLDEMQLKEHEVSVAASLPPKETLVMQHVMFSCPLLGSEIGTYEGIKEAIRTLLYAQLGEDQGVAACLIIRTCNKSIDKVSVCVETLCKYIENIENNPTEDKYRRIRHSNRAYIERVKPVEGSELFLEAAGFEKQQHPFEDTQHTFWVFPPEGNLERLKELRDALVCSEPVRPALERSASILMPTEAAKRPELPPEFFTLSKEELQKEMQLKSEAVEQSMMLRTKAMRERQNMKELRKYRFSLVRVRFPDGLTLQGTFRISEKLSSVIQFVRGYLSNDWRPFYLYLSGGNKVSEEDEEKTLAELLLVPAVVLIFEWDSEVTDPSLDDTEIWGPAADDLFTQQQINNPSS